MIDHIVEGGKVVAKQWPSAAVLGGYATGWMKALTPALQFLILVLTAVYFVYGILVSRKKLAAKHDVEGT